MTQQPVAAEIEAAARSLAADLEWSCPLGLGGKEGWLAVARRALAAAAEARGEEGQDGGGGA